MTEHPLVAAMALDQDTVRRILDTHLVDEHGRCAGCAPDPKLRPTFPCGPRGIAEKAQR